MNNLSKFQRDMLYIVSGLGNPKGVGIKAQLEEYYGKQVHHGRLYPNLDILVDKGLVKKGMKDHRTNEYTITERGRVSIEQRQSWEREFHNPSSPPASAD